MKYTLKRDQAFVDHGFSKEDIVSHKKNYSQPIEYELRVKPDDMLSVIKEQCSTPINTVNISPKTEVKLKDIEPLLSNEAVCDVPRSVLRTERIERNSPCTLPISKHFQSNNHYINDVVPRKSVWPESFFHQEDYSRRDRYEAEPVQQLYDCIKPQSRYNIGFFMQQDSDPFCNIGVSKYEKQMMRERADENKIHHMEFTQDGYKLNSYIPTAEPNEAMERKIRHRRWQNICKTPEPRPDSKLIKAIKSNVSKCSSKIKNLIRFPRKSPANTERNFGGGQYAAHSENLINVHGPHQSIDGLKTLTLLDKDDIKRVGTSGMTTSDNAIFILLWQLVHKHNESLGNNFDDINHIRLIHPTFVQNVFDNGLDIANQLPQMTAFGSQTECTRFLVPVLRHNHFVLLHFGMVRRTVNVHVMDSLNSDSKNMILDDELQKIGSCLFPKKNGKVKIQRVPLEFVNEQLTGPVNTNDCGICVVRNAESCLRNQEFPSNVSVYKKWKFSAQVTASSRDIFKNRLLQWTGAEIDDQDSVPNEFEIESEVKEANIPIAVNKGESINSKCGDVKRRYLEAARRSQKLKKNSCNEKTIPARVQRIESKPFGRPLSMEREEKGVKKSHKKSEVNHDTNRERKEVHGLDPSILNNFLLESDRSISCLSQREQSNLLKRIQEIVRSTVAAKAMTSPPSQSTSSSGEQYKCVEPLQKEFTMEQKKSIVDSYFKQKTPIGKLIKRFSLYPDVKSARVQILRMDREVSNDTPNRRQAYRLLRNRVQTLIEHKDDVLMEDIHGDDIQRTGMEQSICFGIKKFKASTKWLHEMKNQMNFVSRHIDSRKKKTTGSNNDAVNASIKHFLEIVVPRIRKKYSVDNIYNVDQTGLEYELKMNRTLTKRGRNKVERVVQRKNAITHSYTVNPCISAAGKLIAKTFVTLKEPKAPRSFRSLVAPYNKLHITHHTSGKMTSRLANEWMEEVFVPSVNNNSVLMVDSWAGFNEMKNLPIVARKKIEIIVIPPGTTSKLQPLDLSFNRQFKQFLKKLEFEVRSKTKLIIGRRDVQLKILNFAVNQFEAPRFAGLLQCGFDTIGLLSTPHQPFETPASHCFSVSATGGKLCSKCSSFCFSRCAWCDELNCVNCCIKHLH